MGNREDKYVVTLSVTRNNETRNIGVMDSFDGGESEAEETKFKRGGMQPSQSLGGTKAVSNVTLEHLYDEWMQEQEPWLEAGVGKAECTVTKQPLDDDGNAFGRPRVYTGKLTKFTPPGHDSESSDAAKAALEISTHGNIG